MQPAPLESRRPGPREARGWQLAISCLGALSFVTGSLAGLFLLGWVIYLREPALAFPFPTLALLGFVPPFVSIGLGVWTWWTNKVWRLASVVAILGGVLALGLGAIDVLIFFGELVRRPT